MTYERPGSAGATLNAMKIIGILGGMSAASTLLYYQRLCEITQDKLGGLHSPELLIRSVDFAVVEALQQSGRWSEAGELLNREAQALERGGAQLLVLATNTMHKLAAPMMRDVGIELIHIADATASAIRTAGYRRPGLIATAFTMEQTFYSDRLRQHDLEPIVPEAPDRAVVHRIIYEQLCRNVCTEASRQCFIAVAERLVDAGADCLILGCTEVGMLLNETNSPAPVFDSTLIHCDAALAAALS